MSFKIKDILSIERLSLLPHYHESNVNVCVYQGKSLLSLFTLLRLIIFIQRIYNTFSLAAPERNIPRKLVSTLGGLLALS